MSKRHIRIKRELMQFARDFNADDFDYARLADCDTVFMRWKEQFVVSIGENGDATRTVGLITSCLSKIFTFSHRTMILAAHQLPASTISHFKRQLGRLMATIFKNRLNGIKV